MGPMRTTAIVMFIIAAAAPFGWLVAMEQLPPKIAAGLAGISDEPWIILVSVNVLLLLIGLAWEIYGRVLDNDLLFPARGNGDNVVSGFTRAKNRLDKLSGVTGWTLHDLRRTTATYLGKLDTPPHVIERVLNHVSGSFAGVAGVYNRHPYLDEMRDALQAWGSHLAQLHATAVQTGADQSNNSVE